MLRKAIRSSKQKLKHWLSVARGAVKFRRTGTTPPRAHQSLVNLHCLTSGRALDWMHAIIIRGLQKYELTPADGALGSLSAAESANFANQIREHGYCVFPQLLPEERCAALEQFARTRPAGVQTNTPNAPATAIYNRERPLADIYRFAEETLIECEEVQRLLADRSLLSVAQDYLECPPVVDIVSLWWSVVNRNADRGRKSTAAQLYHFDMDRVKWLKIFVYLTDVDSRGGPHCLVSGSHRSGAQPLALLSRGYARIDDHELQSYYSADKFVELTGRRGTIMAVDTRAWHKGKPPESRDRLILQFSYCDSLFGANAAKVSPPTTCLPELREAVKRYPRSFERYSEVAMDSCQRRAA